MRGEAWRAASVARLGAVSCILVVTSSCVLRGPSSPGPCPATAELFAPVVGPDDERVISGGFSPDGSEFFFARLSIGRSRSTLFSSRWRDSSWSTAEVLPFSGQGYDRDPFMSPDGRRLFFMSDRADPGKTDPSYDLWVVERKGPSSWGEPRRLPTGINTSTSEESPVVLPNGTLYFVSGRPGGTGGMDVYRATRVNGRYSRAENLGGPVNTGVDELGVYVTPDESLMLIARTSNRQHGYNTGTDILVSERTRAGWSEPRPLPPPVQSTALELAPALSPDGRDLIFTRDDTRRPLQDIGAKMSIYRVDAGCALSTDRARRALRRMRRSAPPTSR
jgi:hypothetical protein